MEDIDYLYTVAELSSVLAGFSALILTVDTGTKEGFSKYVLEQLIRRGIVVAGLALLAPLLFRFGLREQICWSASSLVGSAIFSRYVFLAIRRRLTTGGYLSAPVFYPRLTLLLLATIGSTANIFLGRSDLYLLAVSIVLALTAALLIDFINMTLKNGT